MYIYDIKWTTQTAGPSPCCNQRTELFLLGCQKAMLGHPCPGCFNQSLWQVPKQAKTYTPQTVAKQIIKFAPQPFLTIGGGEPLDQIEELITLCYLLKQEGFHIICYTWRDIQKALINQYGLAFLQSLLKLIMYVDAFIDGPYENDKRIYQENIQDGFLDSIGSSNQHIVLCEPGKLPKSYPLLTVCDFYYDEEQQKLCVKQGG